MRNCIFLFFAFIALSFQHLQASIREYIFPYQSPSFSNYGALGLIQNPTARFLENGALGISWSHNEPYLRGSIIAYPFDWLEASFQYTDINNALYSQVEAFSGSQSLKDKSFDAKIRILKESYLLPQIAIGIRDIGGTGLFSSEYLVMNKMLADFFDISLGLGWGKLNNNSLTNPLGYLSESFNERNDSSEFGGTLNIGNLFSGEAGYFGGVEIFLPRYDGVSIKIELDGINYSEEAIVPLRQESKINIGINYPVSNNLNLKLGYTRGNTINFGFSYDLSLGQKNSLGQKKQQKAKFDRPDLIKRVTSRSTENLYKASLLYLKDEGLSLQKASVNNSSELEIVYSHNKYRSPVLAAGRALNILENISPNTIKDFKVSEVNAGMGTYTFSVNREILKRYNAFENHTLLYQYSKIEPFNFDETEYEFNPSISYPASFFSMGPELINQIGGPDGFFFGDLKWNFDSEILFFRNLSLISKLAYSVANNMGDLKLASDSVLPHVRTDIVKYLRGGNDQLTIDRMQLNYYQQFGESFFLKLSGGIFESMFAGYGFEALYKPFTKNFGVGLEVWDVTQRDYDQRFKLLDYSTITGHLTFYYLENKSNILFSLKGGRYLAEDSGFTFDFSRTFRSGMRLGAYFSLTDISREEFGEGSFDKGFYFWVPIELFSPKYLKRNFGWGLRPITRDGAQSLIYGYPLWGVTDASSKYKFYRNFDDIYD